eukprot:403375807
MIHELRQPLNSVIGGVELLSNSICLSVDDKRNVQIAQHSANILMNLIGNILDIAKFEANKVELDLQYVFIKQTFKSIMELVEFKANEKKLQLQYYFGPEVPDYIYIDSSRFTQIMLNLISNAVKFTSKGFVRVIVNFIPDQQEIIKTLYRRNTAPDKYHQHANDLLQMTSHDSENSQDLLELGKMFQNRLSVKRSLLHISKCYLQDQQSAQDINFEGTLENILSLRNQSQFSKSPDKYNEESKRQHISLNEIDIAPIQETLGINNGQGQTNIRKASNGGKHFLHKSFSGNQILQNCSCNPGGGIFNDNTYLENNCLAKIRSQNQFSRRGSPLQQNQLDEIPEFGGNFVEQEPEEQKAQQFLTTENYFDENMDEEVEVICNYLEAFGSNQLSKIQHMPIKQSKILKDSVKKYHSSKIVSSFKFDDEQGLSPIGESGQKFEGLEEEKQANQNDALPRVSLAQNNDEIPDFIQKSSRDLQNNRPKTSSIMKIDYIQETITNQYASPSNQQDHFEIEAVSSHSPRIPIITQQNSLQENQEDFNNNIQDNQEFTLFLNQGDINQQIPRIQSENRIQQNVQRRDLRSQSAFHSDNFQTKQRKDPLKIDQFKLNPDIVNNQSQSYIKRQASNIPSMISDPKDINERMQHGTLKITIQDTGIGIDEEEQKKLFNPFCQANSKIQKKFGGTGLGLWITKRLLTFMKGKIQLKSTPSLGTTFTLQFPIQGVSFPSQNEAGSSSKLLQLDTNLSKISALILIQDEFNKEILRKFLIKLMCPATFAKDYDDFVQKLQFVQKFNVCIIDADQFCLTQQEAIKRLIKHKKEIELESNKTLTMIVLSNLEFDQRQRKKFIEDRVIIFRKPVKLKSEQIDNTFNQKQLFDNQMSITTPNFNIKSFKELQGEDRIFIEEIKNDKVHLPESAKSKKSIGQDMIIPNRMKQSVRKVSSFKPQNINTLQSPGGFYTIKEEISTSYRKQETFNQKTILIADDTDSNRMYFQALLRSFDIVTKKHINVAEVQNGRDAYEFYKKEPSSSCSINQTFRRRK